MQGESICIQSQNFSIPTLGEIPRKRQVRQLPFLSHNGVDPTRPPLHPSSHFHDNNKTEEKMKSRGDEQGDECMQNPRRPFAFVFCVLLTPRPPCPQTQGLQRLNSNWQQQQAKRASFLYMYSQTGPASTSYCHIKRKKDEFRISCERQIATNHLASFHKCRYVAGQSRCQHASLLSFWPKRDRRH